MRESALGTAAESGGRGAPPSSVTDVAAISPSNPRLRGDGEDLSQPFLSASTAARLLLMCSSGFIAE